LHSGTAVGDDTKIAKGQKFAAAVTSVFGNNIRDYFKILVGFWSVVKHIAHTCTSCIAQLLILAPHILLAEACSRQHATYRYLNPHTRMIPCRQVAGSFGSVFALDWPQVMMEIWLFISTVVQIDFIRFPVSLTTAYIMHFIIIMQCVCSAPLSLNSITSVPFVL
jgi:hypothetical protein